MESFDVLIDIFELTISINQIDFSKTCPSSYIIPWTLPRVGMRSSINSPFERKPGQGGNSNLQIFPDYFDNTQIENKFVIHRVIRLVVLLSFYDFHRVFLYLYRRPGR